MSATATMPLLLELTRPQSVGPSSSWEEMLKEPDIVGTKYNPETQVRETDAGVPKILTPLMEKTGIIIPNTTDPQQDVIPDYDDDGL
jgi:hypothetical protein